MNIMTKNFGKIEVNENQIIYFEEGIPGFRDLKEYVLIEDTESAFCYLQSIQEGNISFIMINPYLLKKDYTINIKEQYIEALGGGEDKEFSIYVIATILDTVEKATVNLVAPVLIQNEKRQGMQIILENTKYTTRHKIIDLMNEGGC